MSSTQGKAKGVFLRAGLAALVLLAAAASSASASPAWHFNGVELSGGEAVLGESSFTTITVPGLVTACEKIPNSKATIGNTAGIGEIGLASLAFGSCWTSIEACSVEAISVLHLPWLSPLTTIGGNHYAVFEEVGIEILYTGEECVLNETVVEIEGSAGAQFLNSTSTLVFSPSTFAATGTELSAFGNAVQWKDVLTLKAIGTHKGQALTVE